MSIFYYFTVLLIAYQPKNRHDHRTLVVDDILYLWAGDLSWPTSIRHTHDSEAKMERISYIDMFYLTRGLWEKKLTTGKPPLGIWGYGCDTLTSRLCFFGGRCGHFPMDECNGYHNSINVLDTINLDWQELSPTTSDQYLMRKRQPGMITFSYDDEELAFIIGGHGVEPEVRQPDASYRKSIHISPKSFIYYYTNECNIFNITTSKYTICD